MMTERTYNMKNTMILVAYTFIRIITIIFNIITIKEKEYAR